MKDDFLYLYYPGGRDRFGSPVYFNNDYYQQALARMQNAYPLGFGWPDNSAFVTFEGGKTRTDIRYAIRLATFRAGSYITGVGSDGRFSYQENDLYGAVLFNTAAEAADAIVARNALHAREASAYPTRPQYVIVPVTLTTVTPKIQITTTETPAKTEYVVGRVASSLGVRFFVDPRNGRNRWEYDGQGAVKATRFSSADEAAKAIQRFAMTHIWSIKVFETKADKKVERSTIAGGTTTRSL